MDLFLDLRVRDMILSESQHQVCEREIYQARTMITEHTRQQDQATAKRETANSELVREYRKVGPAAIKAALLYRARKKEEPKRTYEPREEL